jgi:hypothetical protein
MVTSGSNLRAGRLFLGKRADFEAGQITSDAGGLLLRELGPTSILITVDIYGHWITGKGKKDLTATLRWSKAKPRRPLAMVKPGQK